MPGCRVGVSRRANPKWYKSLCLLTSRTLEAFQIVTGACAARVNATLGYKGIVPLSVSSSILYVLRPNDFKVSVRDV